MGITPEWMSAWGTVAAPLLTILGGWLGWHLRGQQVTRDALPIIRCQWTSGSAGFTCKLEIQNRMNEDLYATEARADGEFAWYTHEQDSGGSIKGSRLHSAPSPLALDWTIRPLSVENFALSVSGPNTRRRIRIKLSSSNRTLRSKWIALESR